jgi:hypothetical protein
LPGFENFEKGAGAAFLTGAFATFFAGLLIAFFTGFLDNLGIGDSLSCY